MAVTPREAATLQEVVTRQEAQVSEVDTAREVQDTNKSE